MVASRWGVALLFTLAARLKMPDDVASAPTALSLHGHDSHQVGSKASLFFLYFIFLTKL